MSIDWYPGHMKKARQQITAVLPTIDVVVELRDARLPFSSANPLLEKLRKGKPCIRVLNKADLADPAVTQLWVETLQRQEQVRALPLDARQKRDTDRILSLCRKLAPRRGQPGRSLRALVVGIPNVGKSTLINTLAGKKIARVGDKPAITTCAQQIDLRNGILLSDTPGLLWPVMDSPAGAQRLAAMGAIGDKGFDSVAVAQFAVAFLRDRYPDSVVQRYRLPEGLDTVGAILEEIGRRRGCLQGGGAVDLQRAAELLLRELRAGALGRISLETPDDIEAERLEEEE